MRVLVIGGGIGGMATAIALEQAGLDPYVLEQAPELTEIGSGIGMHANAMRVLTQPGRGGPRPPAAACGSTPASGGGMDDGRTIFTAALRGHGRALRRGATSACTAPTSSRASCATSRPSGSGVSVALVAVEERPDGVVARSRTATRSSADVMVGADGLRSTVRTALFGEEEARFTGFAAWRGTIPVAVDAAGLRAHDRDLAGSAAATR